MTLVDLFWQTLTNPNIVYLLLIAGLWSAVLALVTPGTGLPEAGAVVLFSLALFGLVRLPVNFIGLAFIILSLGLYLFEVKWPSHGAFFGAGVFTLAVGSVFLFKDDAQAAPLSLGLVAATVTTTTIFFAFVFQKALEVRHRPPVQNPDAVIGALGEAKTDIFKDGAVQVGSELWTAESDEVIPAGTQVQIVKRSGLKLKVARSSVPPPP